MVSDKQNGVCKVYFVDKKSKRLYWALIIVSLLFILSTADSIAVRLKYNASLEYADNCNDKLNELQIKANERLSKENEARLNQLEKEFLKDLQKRQK